MAVFLKLLFATSLISEAAELASELDKIAKTEVSFNLKQLLH